MSPLKFETGVLNAEKLFDPSGDHFEYYAGEPIFVKTSRWGYSEECGKGAYIIVEPGVRLVKFTGNISTYDVVDGKISVPLGEKVVVAEKQVTGEGWKTAVRISFEEENTTVSAFR